MFFIAALFFYHMLSHYVLHFVCNFCRLWIHFFKSICLHYEFIIPLFTIFFCSSFYILDNPSFHLSFLLFHSISSLLACTSFPFHSIFCFHFSSHWFCFLLAFLWFLSLSFLASLPLIPFLPTLTLPPPFVASPFVPRPLLAPLSFLIISPHSSPWLSSLYFPFSFLTLPPLNLLSFLLPSSFIGRHLDRRIGSDRSMPYGTSGSHSGGYQTLRASPRSEKTGGIGTKLMSVICSKCVEGMWRKEI